MDLELILSLPISKPTFYVTRGVNFGLNWISAIKSYSFLTGILRSPIQNQAYTFWVYASCDVGNKRALSIVLSVVLIGIRSQDNRDIFKQETLSEAEFSNCWVKCTILKPTISTMCAKCAICVGLKQIEGESVCEWENRTREMRSHLQSTSKSTFTEYARWKINDMKSIFVKSNSNWTLKRNISTKLNGIFLICLASFLNWMIFLYGLCLQLFRIIFI